MSNLDMVADGSSASSSEWKHLPKFDQFGVVNWTKRLRVWLMRKNRNHLGLEERPHRPADNASTAASVPSSKLFNLWRRRLRLLINTSERRTCFHLMIPIRRC
mmetsp:Transcript_18889/g.27258  ORF Transcript_18889/g.27258 Transcript_18889/m.27258 type:complete len:103 (-) Transcript_18889:474-782(-)